MKWCHGTIRALLSSAHARSPCVAEEDGTMQMAATTKQWTLEELHSLPDDGNKYELVRGELFVTPPPSGGHETILARLTRILEPYVSAQKLGLIYHPRAVLRFEGSEVEPDLMVRQPPESGDIAWEAWPIPILVVEVLSGSTRRRDRLQKRDLYTDADVAEYWIVDPEQRSITVIRPRDPDLVVRDRLTWMPQGASEPLTFDLVEVFGRMPTSLAHTE
jgi:Uma2 family endonuclease